MGAVMVPVVAGRLSPEGEEMLRGKYGVLATLRLNKAAFEGMRDASPGPTQRRMCMDHIAMIDFMLALPQFRKMNVQLDADIASLQEDEG